MIETNLDLSQDLKLSIIFFLFLSDAATIVPSKDRVPKG